MPAFLIAQVTVKNNEKFQMYAQQSAPTFTPYDAHVLVKGKYSGSYSLNVNHSAAAIIQFPSIDTINEWYQSPSYQALIPLRDESADIIFTRYEMSVA